jgi:hypothetical protein
MDDDGGYDGPGPDMYSDFPVSVDYNPKRRSDTGFCLGALTAVVVGGATTWYSGCYVAENVHRFLDSRFELSNLVENGLSVTAGFIAGGTLGVAVWAGTVIGLSAIFRRG